MKRSQRHTDYLLTLRAPRYVPVSEVYGHVLTHQEAIGARTCSKPIRMRIGPRTLTARELWIVDLIAAFGLSDRQIALAVGRSENAVGCSLRNAMNKIGLSTRLDVAKWRLSRGRQ